MGVRLSTVEGFTWVPCSADQNRTCGTPPRCELPDRAAARLLPPGNMMWLRLTSTERNIFQIGLVYLRGDPHKQRKSPGYSLPLR
jgi:hypothetical protein